jgi:parallel beta-helix repeat protein
MYLMGMGKLVVILLLLLMAVPLVALPLHVQAETKTITVPDDYSSIQEAITRAHPGDTVYVKAGDYNGSLIIKKSIALIGQKGARINSWVIDVQPAILVTANNVTIKGLTIDNPNLSPPWKVKRGIHLLGATNCLIENNTITHVDNEGIWLYQSTNNTINHNTINGVNNGISVGASSNNTLTGNILRNNWQAIAIYSESHNNTATGNDLYNNHYGIAVSDGYGNQFNENNIFGSDVGLQIGGVAHNNHFIHNNFVNTKNVDSTLGYVNSTNFFDNGAEGNYYSDYYGADLNGDGVGDTPYQIVAQGLDFLDRYPLMQQWTGTSLPPVISIFSPVENATYSSEDVLLNFTVSKPIAEIKYSLDGAATVATTENLTLTKLGNGNHNLTVFATGLSGNEAQPKTVNFTVTKPPLQLDSIVLLATVPILVVILVGVALLLLRKRRLVKKP